MTNFPTFPAFLHAFVESIGQQKNTNCSSHMHCIASSEKHKMSLVNRTTKFVKWVFRTCKAIKIGVLGRYGPLECAWNSCDKHWKMTQIGTIFSMSHQQKNDNSSTVTCQSYKWVNIMYIITSSTEENQDLLRSFWLIKGWKWLA